MRYAQGGGLTAEGRRRRERVRSGWRLWRDSGGGGPLRRRRQRGAGGGRVGGGRTAGGRQAAGELSQDRAGRWAWRSGPPFGHRRTVSACLLIAMLDWIAALSSASV